MDDKHQFPEEIERKISKDIVENEWSVTSADQSHRTSDYQAHLDMFDAVRSEKTYKWQSNISMPEFATHMLVQSANDVDQYFSSLDFVETYVMDEAPEAVLAAKATKKLINKTLNRRNLYHYHKFVRGKLINTINGYSYARCWWNQDIKTEMEEQEDANGLAIQVPVETIKKDCFEYEILDPRNVVESPEYVYSIQDKKFVIIWSRTNYEELLSKKDTYGYFNLNIVKELRKKKESEIKDTKSGKGIILNTSLPSDFDKYERFGKFWVKDKKNGKIEPGLDEDGEVNAKARLAECVITIVDVNGSKVLIGFHETPYIDLNGNPYRPIIRGLCYIHPEVDSGVGDGKYSRELQMGINDTINIANDRAMLATLPTLKVKEGSLTDNDSIFFAPGHAMKYQTDPNDILEFKIDSDIMGALNMYRMYEGKMQQVTSKYPPDMGNIPSLSSTTATASSVAATSSSKRDKYKDLTWENTFGCDLYWMIQQMTWAFARPETGKYLMGELIYDFNPSYDFWFKPVSQAIESEQSKQGKIKYWQQLATLYVQIQHPDVPKVLNEITKEISALMGKEYQGFGDRLTLDESQPIIPKGGNPEQMNMGDGASNEEGISQGQPEIYARENA